MMNLDSKTDTTGLPSPGLPYPPSTALVVCVFGWIMLSVLAAFLFNNFLTYWLGWPGAVGVAGHASLVRSWTQAGLYPAAFAIGVTFAFRNFEYSLRAECQRISKVSSFVIRGAFWAVLLIGLSDFVLAFLRGEDLLIALVGKEFAAKLVRADFRGTFVHMPLIGLSLVVAAFTRSIGIVWLALLIVIAELLIVMSRFVFSYEQVYMTDLVRFWYAALFLFGCAYTLREEGQGRVEVLYANFTSRPKGLVNALGTLLLGMPLCWLILVIGLSGKTGIINSALLNFEIEGLGDGLYVLYLMTVFMGIFAISMLIEFVSFLFNSVADFLEEPTIPNPNTSGT